MFIDEIISYFNNEKEDKVLLYEFKSNYRINEYNMQLSRWSLVFIVCIGMGTIVSSIISTKNPGAIPLYLLGAIILVPMAIFTIVDIIMINKVDRRTEETNEIAKEISILKGIIRVLYVIKVNYLEKATKGDTKEVLLSFSRTTEDIYLSNLLSLLQRIKEN